ncbi:MAG TPA: methionyl-tRNA formyltransferase [Candidatus Krumholzibacteria bacterium]|nr:methionyl-tRNA formyltransferase [Candidatus Krumholzibacteria bacterium]
MRLVFLGSPEFAIPSLEALVRAGHELALVVTQPDKARGRGRTPLPTPVRRRAKELGLRDMALQPKARQEAYRQILDCSPQLAVVVAFGHLIREPLLHGPSLGCLNVHASLLPRWRGAAPIHRAIIAGDERTGVCTMRLEKGMDTGPVYAQEETPIGPEETAGELHDRLAVLGAQLLLHTIDEIQSRGLAPRPQASEGVTIAPMLRKEEGTVDFARSAQEVHDRIRGLCPWPGVAVLRDGETLKLKGSRLLPELQGKAGEILAIDEDGMSVGCAQGAVRIHFVQRAGGRFLPPLQFARGFPLRAGDKLSPLADVPARVRL